MLPKEDNKKISQDFDISVFEEAIRLRNNGKIQESLYILDRLLSKYPEKIALLALAARMYWKLGKLERAIDLFRTAVHLKPECETVSLGLFHCLWETGKQLEALEEVKRFMSVSYSKDYMDIVREINKQG